MWPCWVHVAFQNGVKRASSSPSISLDSSPPRARCVPAVLVALRDCTAERSVSICLRCSGIGKGFSSAPEVPPEVIYENSAPELHPEVIYGSSAPELPPEVIYESSYTHFHQLCCEDNPQKSSRAGSLAGTCLNLGLDLGWSDSPLSFAKPFVFSGGKHKVGVNGDDDLSEMFCRHVFISGVRAGLLQNAVRDAVWSLCQLPSGKKKEDNAHQCVPSLRRKDSKKTSPQGGRRHYRQKKFTFSTSWMGKLSA